MRLLVIACLMVLAGPCLAQQQITMQVGAVQTVTMPRPAQTIIVANEGVVRAEPVAGSNLVFRLRAEAKGLTTITVQDAAGVVFYNAVVTVGSPERIITIISKTDSVTLKKADGSDTQKSIQKVHDEWTYRCDDSRCVRFQQRGRELERDDPHLSPDVPRD